MIEDLLAELEADPLTRHDVARIHSELGSLVGSKRAMEHWIAAGVRMSTPTRVQLATLAERLNDTYVSRGAPDPVVVNLELHEVMYAEQVATTRHILDLKDGKTPRFGDPNQMLWHNIIGCGGEIAVAKHLGLYWNGAVGDFKADDVGKFQVRTSSFKPVLNVYSWDKTDRWFIAVCGVPPKLKILGCIHGTEAKQDRFFSKTERGNTYYMIPPSKLLPLSALPCTS